MKSHQKKLNIFWVLIIMILASCDGDGGSSVTGPGTLSSDVAGIWEFSGQMSANTCTFLEVEIGSPSNDWITVAQEGSTLTGVDSSGNMTLRGRVSGNSFSLTQTNPSTSTVDSCTFSAGSEIAVRRTNETSGRGTWNIVWTGNCPLLQLPCTVVSTGSWIRR